MDENKGHLTVDDILAELKSSNRLNGTHSSQENTNPQRYDTEVDSLDIYIKYGQVQKPIEEIQSEILSDIQQKKQDTKDTATQNTEFAVAPSATQSEEVIEAKKEPEQEEKLASTQPEEKDPQAVKDEQELSATSFDGGEEMIDKGNSKENPFAKQLSALFNKDGEASSKPVKGQPEEAGTIPNNADTEAAEEISPDSEAKKTASSVSDTQIFDKAVIREKDGQEPSPEEYDYQTRRKKKIEQFFSLEDEDDFFNSKKMLALQEKQQKQEEKEVKYEDYESYDDTKDVSYTLNSMLSGLSFKSIFLSIIAVIAIYIGIAPTLHLPVPSILLPQTEPFIYSLVNLVLAAFSILFSYKTIGEGLISAFTFRPDTDSVLAVSFLFTVIYNCIFLFNPEALSQNGVHLLTPIALTALAINSIGKLLVTSRIRRNFKLVSSQYEKHAAINIDNEQVLAHLTRLSSYDETQALCAVQTGFLSGFLDNSYAEEPSENLNKVLSPLVFVGSLLIGVVSYFLNKDIMGALTVFIISLSITCPLTSCISTSLIMNRLSKKLSRKGAMISGYSAIDEVAASNGVIINSADLFPAGSITIHGVKTFENQRIDKAIIDAASVVCSTKGTFTDVFMQVIEGKSGLLRPVDSVICEDGMGISAWIDSQRVLVGNRQLMINHGIDVPSKDYEKRYINKSRELLYLSVAGTLTAMFIISYQANEEVQKALEDLQKSGYDIFIKTSDSNITAEKIGQIYDIDPAMLKVIPGSVYKQLDECIKPAEKKPAKLAHTGSFPAFAAAICGGAKARTAISLSLILQTIGIVVGFILVALLVFVSGIAQLSVAALLLYQLFWAALTLIIPRFTGV